jgi:predicted transcriptional regulator
MEKRKVEIIVGESAEDALKRFADSFKRIKNKSTVCFETVEQYCSTLTANRWRMIYALQAAKGEPVGVRELARRLGKDAGYVSLNAKPLINCGMIKRNDDGALFCPYSEIEIKMMNEEKVAA